jgi:3'-phosphoadenosine 5'-phosphosulfate sulfotransferase (PAPS reductase)/FAD synthetase
MKHIVALSGGKDSTAMALRLVEVEPRDYLYICTPTGDELPEMEDHWNNLECLLGKKLIRICVKTIYELIREMNMLPNWRARWCTRILKIEAVQEFYEENKPAVVYVGLRYDEQKREGNRLYDDNIEQVFPMQKWGWDISHVLGYLDKKGVTVPRRTDCAMCFYQRLGEWWNLWKIHPERFKIVEDLEEEIGHTLLSPGKFKNWPYAVKDLRAEFEKGRIPRGANVQTNLFNENQCRACTL